MIDFTLPVTEILADCGAPKVPNAVTSAEGYKPYPTAKNIPNSLKSSSEKKAKSSELAGYEGEVLAKAPLIREGKGLQQFVDGSVQEGYF